MIALHFANIIYKDNKHFFEDKCAVLGSGPYKGYYYNDPLPNTKIFVLGVTYIPSFENTETEGDLAIDGFLYKCVNLDNGDEKHYTPVIVLNKTYNGDTTLYSLLQTVKGLRFLNNDRILNVLHDFTIYNNIFNILLKNNNESNVNEVNINKVNFNEVNGDLDISNSIIHKLENENL